MKLLGLLSLVALLGLQVSCGSSNKYDKKRLDIQREEAKNLIDKSDDIEIKRGWGNDKIILKDM